MLNLNPSAECIDVQTVSGNLMQVVRTCTWVSLAAAVQNTQVMQFIIPANDSAANRDAVNIEASISTQGEPIDAMGNNLSFMNRLQEALERFYFYLPLITS